MTRSSNRAGLRTCSSTSRRPGSRAFRISTRRTSPTRSRRGVWCRAFSPKPWGSRVLPPDDPHRPVEAADVAHDRLFRLDGNAYVVFGAGAGIGEHISRTLRAQGARLLCVDVEADRAEYIGK